VAEHRDVTIRPTLCIVPAFVRNEEELDVLLRCLVSLRGTAPDAQVLVIDDASPAPELVSALEIVCDELGIACVSNDENSGFSATVNAGLELALHTGQDAVLVNADIEFLEGGWLERMRARTDSQGRPAAVVGARLLYPNGLIQHAGIFLSPLHRDWLHRFQYGPADLPEAMVPTRCPVTAALQLIRYETLEQIGLYDETYKMCFEDLDYCLRVFEAGLDCIYEPTVVATHREKFFRGKADEKIIEWTRESTARMLQRWGRTDLSQWVPEVL
jgi:GT2 family glycosyltransferase